MSLGQDARSFGSESKSFRITSGFTKVICEERIYSNGFVNLFLDKRICLSTQKTNPNTTACNSDRLAFRMNFVRNMPQSPGSKQPVLETNQARFIWHVV